MSSKDTGQIYTNEMMYKRPLAHARSNPTVPEKPKRAPPKPKLPADLAADIKSPRKVRSPNSDDAVPTTPSRYASLTSSRGSTPDSDIIPISVPKRSSNEYENAVDYENDEVLTSSTEMHRTSPTRSRNTPITTSYEQKPAVPSRLTNVPWTLEKSSTTHRDRAGTTGDMLSSAPPIKPRSMTVVQTKHDYEEIEDEIGQYFRNT